jgi:mannosyltransferase OCH1-like enzyme
MNYKFNLLLFLIILIIVLIIYLLYHFNIIENMYNNIPEKYNDENKVVKGIPKIIHQIMPKDKNRWHTSWFICHETWLAIFPEPEYTHMTWYDDELEEIIKSDFPWFLDIFRGYPKNINRIDIVRPFILYKYGGIYADMDYIVYKNFYNDLPDDKVSIPESPYKENEFIQNALMCSPINHKFWLLVIDECYNTKNDNVFLATGPRLLTNIYYKNSEMVNILPIDLYNPHVGEKDKFHSDNVITKHYLSTMW